ncbi:tRNA (guanine-N(1))-methyltransferase [Ceratobasidium sp. AG-Ba]|nr:tRNA (guanine-N(1))-methyltransferase [Ceratobasidium sp. AG-Ba]
MATLELNPPVNRSMKDLDRNFFRITVPVLAAEIDARQTGELLRSSALRGSILDIPKITNVVKGDSGNDSKRLLLLGVKELDQLPVAAKQLLAEQAAQVVSHSINLDYDYWTADQILRAVLPPELGEGSPTAFSINGHIAHMNLRDEYLPYRYLIGQVILDKNKTIRTVVNKLDNIETEFRFFKMEVLAGEPDFIIKHNESNCTFTLDFSTVYWNSRLAHEHERLVNLFSSDPKNPTPLVADVFAGVGPFAVPAAKRGALVFGNDLNPESTKWMEVNVKNNKVIPRVRITTLDGRQFIQDVVQTAWTSPFGPEAYVKPLTVRERRNKQKVTSAAEPSATSAPELEPPREQRRIDHFVMNLPGMALEFLDAFKRSFASLASSQTPEEVGNVYDVMPMIHVHCFTRELEEEGARKDILERAQTALGAPIDQDIVLHHVRKVAPNKDMYCLSFRLPRSFISV